VTSPCGSRRWRRGARADRLRVGVIDRLADRQHFAVAAVSAWLVGTSPWIGMLRRLPRDAGWLDRAHVVLGFAALLLGVTYTIACLRGGGWRSYFPWLAGRLGAVGRDVAGLARGRIPAAEGGGLFGALEGLLLVLLVITAATGAAWYLAQGGSEALTWRGYHVLAARVFAGALVLHVVTVSLHLVDFVRD
jgi:hypothetical protein